MRNLSRVVGLIVIMLGFATSARAATSGWSRLSLPAGHSVIGYRVSCASQGACFALGNTGSPQFVRYTGTHATRLKGPRGAGSSIVNALSCASATTCVAVGITNHEAGHGLLAWRWSGGHWSALSLPAGPGRSLKQNVTHYELTGLSCPSTTKCVAVGQVQGFTAKSHGVTRPLLYVFNGRHWSSVRSPLRAGTLRAVSCASRSACTAVGAATSAAVLRLHGGRWTRVRLSPLTSREVGTSLTSISCPTATSCLAGGVLDTTPNAALPVTRVVTLRQSGAKWSTDVPPVPASAPGGHPHELTDALDALSCGAPGSCLGIGVTLNNDGNDPQQTGLSLAFTPGSPQPVAQIRPVAVSVSCPSAAFCLVGGGGSVSRYTP